MRKCKHKKLLGGILFIVGLIAFFVTLDARPLGAGVAKWYAYYTSAIFDLLILFAGIFIFMKEGVDAQDGWIDLDRQRNRLIDSLRKIEERCAMCVDGCRNNCRVLSWKKKMQNEVDYLADLIVKSGGRIVNDRN